MISGGSGETRTTIYNPHDDTWERGGDLNVGRGYHSHAVLPDGSVFTLGGVSNRTRANFCASSLTLPITQSWIGGWNIPPTLFPDNWFFTSLYHGLFFLRYYLFGWFFDLFLFKRKDGELWSATTEEWRDLDDVRSQGSFLTNDGRPQLRDNHMYVL